MKFFTLFVSVIGLIGVCLLSGCSHQQAKTAAAPPTAAPAAMQRQATTRAQNDQAGLQAMMQHMHQGPPAGATTH